MIAYRRFLECAGAMLLTLSAVLALRWWGFELRIAMAVAVPVTVFGVATYVELASKPRWLWAIIVCCISRLTLLALLLAAAVYLSATFYFDRQDSVVPAIVIFVFVSLVLHLAKRPKFEFSLGEMLLFVTACAIPCSWCAVRMQQTRKREFQDSRECAMLDMVRVKYAGAAEWTDKKPHDELGKEIVGVQFDCGDVDDADLRFVGALTQLREFSSTFYCSRRSMRRGITDAGLVHLSRLTQLEVLELQGAHISDAGLSKLRSLTKLRTLEVSVPPKDSTGVTDAGLAQLKGLTQLRKLSLKNCRITDAGLQYLSEMRQLQELGLSRTDVTDAGLASLAGMTQLRSLELGSTRISGPGLEHLKSLGRLRELELSETNITDTGLRHIESLTQIRRLSLRQTSITDAGLKYLSGLRDLEDLDLGEVAITDAGLKHLSGLTRLEHVWFCLPDSTGRRPYHLDAKGLREHLSGDK